MEASYFYYRPSDLIWNGRPGLYLDKGFNVKFVYQSKNKDMPNIAIGLDDFAGTGFFTREYIVTTKQYKNLRFTLGTGWGKFTGENTFRNPLSELSNSFSSRPLLSENYNLGGSPSYDQWFRGDAALFGGVEFNLPKLKNTKIKIEYDPFDYQDFSSDMFLGASKELRKKDSKINFGFSIPINDLFTIDASYVKGNTLNLNFNLAISINNQLSKKRKFTPVVEISENYDDPKNGFYNNLLNNLNKNKLFLQTANLNQNGKLDIAISTSDHRNSIRASSYSGYIAQRVAKESQVYLSRIDVTSINAGIELNKISYVANHLNENNNIPYEVKIRNTNLEPGYKKNFYNNEFKPNVNFPVVFSSLSPSIVSHIGNPERFYFGGLNLQYVGEIQLTRSLLISTEINQSLYSNFKDTISGPQSKLEHVRTDIVQYLKEDDVYIGRAQIDYIWSPYRNVYTKISGGIFESMFGGIGGELLYKPFNKNFSLGMEIFHVKQRSFNQRFDFKDYKTTTGHINLNYNFAMGIELNLSFGRYLAKDDGYTFDLGRRTQSGFKSGVYFTRTNISAELFGEGSFDKGFYFQIPIDLFSRDYVGNYSTFKLSPLTRDGGAKLIHGKDLKGLIYNSRYKELKKQWDGFLN